MGCIEIKNKQESIGYSLFSKSLKASASYVTPAHSDLVADANVFSQHHFPRLVISVGLHVSL
jgi:hypothetical protein